MKTTTGSCVLAVAALSSLLAAAPAQAGVFVGHCGYYHGGFVGFGFTTVCAPAPVFFAPPPVVYYAPPVYLAPAPVVVQRPVVVQPAPVVAQPAPATQQTSNFVEMGRRYHRHGDNEGRLDWVEGLLDGVPVRVYYDDFGRIRKQEIVD